MGKVLGWVADEGGMLATHRVLPFSSAKSGVTAFGLDGEPFCLSGKSAAMERVWSQVRRVGPHFRTALLVGEEGCGAEAVARALHEASPFRHRPLKVLNAAAAEVRFGVRGSGEAQGVFYLAEIEKLSAAAQNGLLRVVRLRGTRAACVVGFAKNDLRALVSAGGFSAELAGALGALRIALPSLRERCEDLQGLLRGVMRRVAAEMDVEARGLAQDFIEAVATFAWPRNLPQMDAVVRWLLTERAGYVWSRAEFEAACAVHGTVAEQAAAPVRMVRLEQMVQEHIRAVLVACEGNKLRAAEVLGISRSTLYRMLDASVGSMLAMAG